MAAFLQRDAAGLFPTAFASSEVGDDELLAWPIQSHLPGCPGLRVYYPGFHQSFDLGQFANKLLPLHLHGHERRPVFPPFLSRSAGALNAEAPVSDRAATKLITDY